MYLLTLLSLAACDIRSEIEPYRDATYTDPYDVVGENVVSRTMELDVIPLLLAGAGECMTNWTFRFGDEIDFGKECETRQILPELEARYASCKALLDGEVEQSVDDICPNRKDDRLAVLGLRGTDEALFGDLGQVEAPLPPAQAFQGEEGWLEISRVPIELLGHHFGDVFTGCYVSVGATAELNQLSFEEFEGRWRDDLASPPLGYCNEWEGEWPYESETCLSWSSPGPEPAGGPVLELSFQGAGRDLGNAHVDLEVTCTSEILEGWETYPSRPDEPEQHFSVGVGFSLDEVQFDMRFTPRVTDGWSYHGPWHPINLRAVTYEGETYYEPHEVASIEAPMWSEVRLDGWELHEPILDLPIYEDAVSAFVIDQVLDPLVNELVTEHVTDSLAGQEVIQTMEAFVGGSLSTAPGPDAVCGITYDATRDLGPVIHHGSPVNCP